MAVYNSNKETHSTPKGSETRAGAHGDLLHDLWRNYVPISDRFILFASLGVNLLALALPLMILQVYNRILPYEGLSTLAMLSIGVATAFVFDMVLKIARARLAGWAGAQYEHKAGCLAIKRLVEGSLSHIEETPSGRHMDRLSSVELIREFYASQASLALIDLPFILVFILVLGLVAGWIVLIPIVMLMGAGYLAWKLGNRLQDDLSERRLWDQRRYSFLIEALSGIYSVKVMAMEPLMQRRYERLLESNAEASARVSHTSNLAQTVGTVTSQLTVALVVGFGALQVIAGNLSVGALAASTLLAGRTVQPALRALGLWSRFQSVAIAENNLKELDDIPVERHGSRKMEPFISLETSALAFRYKQGDPQVLKDVNLTVKKGEAVGISGSNGSGKSTLLHLIAGQLLPTEGTVRLNGYRPSDYDAASIFHQLAYIPQRPTLFHGTVLENLTLFQTDDMDVLQYALFLAAQLKLDEVFARMPKGYDTEIADSSANLLPAGVAQRITIARSLLHKPSLILFDEANTGLDRDSDEALTVLMTKLKEEQNVAMILVSHRPSLLSLADHRHVLTDGTLRPADNGQSHDAKGQDLKGKASENKSTPESPELVSTKPKSGGSAR